MNESILPTATPVPVPVLTPAAVVPTAKPTLRPTPTPAPTATPLPLFTITLDDFEEEVARGATDYWRTSWRLNGAAFITGRFNARVEPHGGSEQLVLRGEGSGARRASNLSRETAVRLQLWAKAYSFVRGRGSRSAPLLR